MSERRLGRLADMRDAIAAWPAPAVWGRCAGLLALFLACALPFGWMSGLIRSDAAPLTPPAVVGVAVTLLLHPAFTEELIFRALLLPRRPDELSRSRLIGIVAVALALYVAAHPVNARLFEPAASSLFTNPSYLLLAALLGLTCSAAYLISGSIWPPVFIHWIVVAIWLLRLGGWRLVRG